MVEVIIVIPKKKGGKWLEKILTELKRFKKRASERERTSKINAFEMKNRSGAQNIKEKLLKQIRGKSNWSCPYLYKSIKR